MGKKRGRTTGRSLVDQLPNRAYVKVEWAAASTTAVYETVETMMGAMEGAAWLISRIEVIPTVVPALPGASILRFQVCTGKQTALLDCGDAKVIGTMDRMYSITTSGATTWDWPAVWVGPVLVASRNLTCLMDASTNVAPWQAGTTMLFTIWYSWVKMTAQKWLEIKQAEGVV